MLFVSGPADGRRMEVDSDARSWRVPIPPPLPLTAPRGQRIEELQFAVADYELQRFVAPTRIVEVFAPLGQDPGDTLLALIRGYSPQKRERD
jgi:hypothetical protein